MLDESPARLLAGDPLLALQHPISGVIPVDPRSKQNLNVMEFSGKSARASVSELLEREVNPGLRVFRESEIEFECGRHEQVESKFLLRSAGESS